MVMVLGRMLSFGTAGGILALMFAAAGQYWAPNGHLLILQGQDAFHLVQFISALLGIGFGAVAGAVSGSADAIMAAIRRDAAADLRAAGINPRPNS